MTFTRSKASERTAPLNDLSSAAGITKLSGYGDYVTLLSHLVIWLGETTPVSSYKDSYLAYALYPTLVRDVGD